MDSWYFGNFVHFCELWLHSLHRTKEIFRVVVVVFGIRILELFYFEKLRLLGISYTLVFSLKIW